MMGHQETGVVRFGPFYAVAAAGGLELTWVDDEMALEVAPAFLFNVPLNCWFRGFYVLVL
jgi:hypothetical protein